MAFYEPIYRLRIYDSDDSTVLTPRAGSAHSDPFQVATATGVSGYEAYLDIPRGRRGSFDPISRRVDTGQLTLRILDPRTGSANSERWVTAFVGDDEGASLLLGKRVEVDESLDDGSSWGSVRFFTGAVTSTRLAGKNVVEIKARDLADDLNDEVFFGPPSSLLDYVASAPLLPLGIVEDYGTVEKSPPLKGSTETWTLAPIGSGLKIVVDMLDESNLRNNIITRPLSRIATTASVHWGSGLYVGPNPTRRSTAARIRLEITSGARLGETGDFYVGLTPSISTGGIVNVSAYSGQFYQVEPIGDKFAVAEIGLVEVGTEDPNYLALPPASVDVEFYLVGADSPPSKETPVLVSDVDPLDFVADILDGKFGAVNEDGTAKRSYPYKAASLSAITREFPSFRAYITKAESINDVLEKWVCLPYNLGYRVDGDGDVVFFDLDLPTTAAGITTIDSDDISDGSAPSNWEVPIDSAITRIDATFYLEEYVPVEEILASPDRVPDFPAFRVTELKVPFVKIDVGNPDLGERKIKIDAKGFRFLSIEDAVALPTTANVSPRDAIIRDLDELTEKLRIAYGDGVALTSISGKRSSSSVSTCFGGDLRILDVDEFPNPSGNIRGGNRLVRCVSRREEGLSILLGFADAGSSTVAVAPTIGALALTSGQGAHSVDVPVTLNAAGDNVHLYTATTETSVGTRPVDDSGLWKFAALVDATGTVSLPGHRAGMRIWVAGRSFPDRRQGLKLPSVRAYPSGNDYIDTTAIGTPSSFVVTPSGNRGVATWTNSGDYPVEVWLVQGADEVRLARLPSGSDEYTYLFLELSTSYTGKIRYVDPVFGPGAFVSDAFVTTGTPDAAPDLVGVTVVLGDTV